MKQFTVSTSTQNRRTAIQALFRQVWLLLLCCALTIAAFAQDGGGPDDDDETYEIDSIGMEQWFDALTSSLAEVIPECYPVSFSKKIPVLFENSFALYLEIAGHTADTLFLTNVTAGGVLTPVAVEGGRAIIRGLPYNQQFFISGMNSCGEMEHSFSFFTNEQALTEEEGNVVVFSEEMFLLAAAFGVQNEANALPMHAFLNAAEGYQHIHYFEKLNFYQQYARKGAKFPDAIEHLNAIPSGLATALKEGEDCKCEILVLHSIASPADGEYEEYGKIILRPAGNGDGHFFNSESGVRRWGMWLAKGASQNYMAHTRGNKVKCDPIHSVAIGKDGEVSQEDVDDRPISYGSISLNLICNDRNELPKECDCSKKVVFDYKYGARLDVEAMRGPAGIICQRRRKASAAADAYAVVYCDERRMTHGGINNIEETQIIDLGRWQAKAECNTQFNPQWDTAFFNFVETVFGGVTLGDIINAIGDSSTNLNFGDFLNAGASIPELVQALVQWLRTDYNLDAPCEAKSLVGNGLRGHFETILEPNKQLWFYVSSSGLAQALGQRSWHSAARVRSAYSMVVSTNPGKTDEAHVGCCSDWAAAFVGGAYDEPWHSGTLWRDMGGDIFSMNPSFEDCLYFQAGFPYSKGDIGGCKTPARTAECKDVEVVIPRHYDSDDDHASSEPGSITAAFIFNAQGQIVKSLRYDALSSYVQLEEELRHLLQGMPPGVYFVQYQIQGQLFVNKYVHLTTY